MAKNPQGKKHHTLMRLFIVLLLASAVTLLYFEVLVIRKVEFVGNQRFDSDELLAMSGMTYGESMLRLDKARITQSMEENPYIVVESVKRSYPDRVVITIRERRATALCDYMGRKLLLDAEGVVLAITDNVDEFTLPTITGWDVTSAVPGQAVGVAQDVQRYNLQQVLQELERQGVLGSISSIDITSAVQIRMVTADGMQIKLGNTDNMPKKIAWVVQMLPQLQAEGMRRGTLDVSATDTASYTPEAVTNGLQTPADGGQNAPE
nr:FtsQ-type POTRA domain-containing protein [Maliibacterium massiliense]